MDYSNWARQLPSDPYSGGQRGAMPPLSRREGAAIRCLVERVRSEVDAVLAQASLFGSRARGEARIDSDLDILLVFRRLPPDREPQAGYAEDIAEKVAAESGVPVTVWSVSLIDLREGNRTPMLVDALRDSIPVWARPGEVIPSVPFTPADAVRCARALLDRVAEGSEEFAIALKDGDLGIARRRARDDLVRLCTAFLLLRGITQPRRAGAVDAFSALEFGAEPPPHLREALDWARDSFGPDGKEEAGPVPPPPLGFDPLAETIDELRWRVRVRTERLGHRLNGRARQ